jgi:subtilisin-like proprotein convertase family protein
MLHRVIVSRAAHWALILGLLAAATVSVHAQDAASTEVSDPAPVEVESLPEDEGSAEESAQAEATEPTPTESATTPAPDESGSISATPAPVVTESVSPAATETPTSEQTEAPAATPAATAELTATLTLEATEAATAEATVPVLATEIVEPPAELPAEPEMGVFVSSSFDDVTLMDWTASGSWAFVSANGGLALETSTSSDPIVFNGGDLFNAAIEGRFQFERGGARLIVRRSAVASYSAVVSNTGEVALYRGENQYAAALVEPIASGEWWTIRLSVVDDVLRVTVNGTEVIAVRDEAPLPPGQVAFAAEALDGAALRVDDVAVWLPLADLPERTPTPNLRDFGITAEGLTDLWLVRLDPGADPAEIAQQLGFTYLMPVGSLPDTYIFRMPPGEQAQRMGSSLRNAPRVRFAEQQVAQQRFTRDPDDPLFDEQWHLRNTGQFGGTAGIDANVVDAWNAGYTGEGVTISIVDDGLQRTHPDLSPNYNATGSFDWNGNDTDPSPTSADSHGTSVGGVAAAADDGDECGVGAAYNADLSAQRLIAGPSTTAQEAAALTYAYQENDIYNNSWGPGDFGFILEPLPQVVEDALIEGVTNGRGGLGNIYLWAAGNGLANNDYSNADGYANSRYSIAVSAITNDGEQAWYSEPGANILITAPSSGGSADIYTTDLLGSSGYNGVSDNDCTNEFGGTSSATPLVAGVVALMLDANENLTWRDVQTILVETAVQNDPTDPDWETNGAGFPVNHKYGFGMVDAGAAVALAESWAGVGDETSYATGQVNANQAIPDNNPTGINRTVNIATDSLGYIESMELIIDVTHTWRGDVQIEVISPSGTESVLMQQRPNDSFDNYESVLFTSVHFWGEDPNGTWTVNVSDRFSGDSGTFNHFEIRLYGPEPGDVAPRTPTNLRLTSFTDSQVNLAWNDRAVGETDYRIERRSLPAGAWGEIAVLPPNSVSYSDTGVICESSYEYRVAANNTSTGLKSTYSNILPVTLPNCPTPAKVTLQSPSDRALVAETQPLLTWGAATGAVNYELQIATESRFNAPLAFSTVTNLTSITPDVPLSDREHYWRVRGLNVLGEPGAWSNTRRFTVDTLAPQEVVALIDPANLRRVGSRLPTFSWGTLRDAGSYRIQVDDDDTFDTPLIDQIATRTRFTSPILLGQGSYFWRVLPIDRAGNEGSYGPAPQFFVDILSLPSNGTYTTDTTPSFRWASERGILYSLEVDEVGGDFSSPVFSCLNIAANTCTPALPLPFGQYIWRVNIAGVVSPFTRSLIITPPLPVAPLTTAPANGSAWNTDLILLDWADVPDADTYEVHIDDNSRFSSPELIEDGIGASAFEVDTALLNDGRFYWRVRGVNLHGAPGAWSRRAEFIVDRLAPAHPGLRDPLNGALMTDTTPAFRWNAVNGVRRYQIDIATDEGFNLLVVDAADVTSTSFTLPDVLALSPETIYFWRVFAVDPAGNVSQPSETRLFRVSSMSSPLEGSFVADTTPTFRWVAERSIGYTVQVIEAGGDFDAPVFTCMTIGGGTCTPMVPLGLGAHEWRLLREGVPLSMLTFTITPGSPAAPTLTAPLNGTNAGESDTQRLDWTATSSTAGAPYMYQVIVDDDRRFGSPDILSEPIDGLFTDLDISSLPNGRYYWAVRALDVYGTPGAWSRSRDFWVGLPPANVPVLSSPENNLRTTDNTPDFRWNSIRGVSGYRFELSTSDTFDTLLYPAVVTTSTRYILPNPLALPNGVYYWRVFSLDGGGVLSDPSAVRRIVVSTP